MSETRTTDASNGDDEISLADGRTIAFRTYGAPNGQPVIALHGTPGSRLLFSAADAPARALGLRVIALDRWGYGKTSAHPEPSLSRFAADVSQVADRLGLSRFAVMGVSGGGPYAAAVAACLSQRVTAVALVVPVGPIAGEPPDGIVPFHRFCFGPFGQSPAAVAAVFHVFRGCLRISDRIGMALATIRVPAADRSVVSVPGVRARLARTFREGLRQGVAGPVTDLLLFGRPWDVPLGNISAPAQVWLGLSDANIPIPAARRLASRIPGCGIIELSGEGHLWVALRYGMILEWIAG